MSDWLRCWPNMTNRACETWAVTAWTWLGWQIPQLAQMTTEETWSNELLNLSWAAQPWREREREKKTLINGEKAEIRPTLQRTSERTRRRKQKRSLLVVSQSRFPSSRTRMGRRTRSCGRDTREKEESREKKKGWSRKEDKVSGAKFAWWRAFLPFLTPLSNADVGFFV